MENRRYKVYAEIQATQDAGDTANGYVPVPRYWADDVTEAFERQQSIDTIFGGCRRRRRKGGSNIKTLVYLAGPIMGVPDYKERFLAAPEELQRNGRWVPVHTAWLPDGLPESVYMPVCLALLNECEAICLLPGWENSKGALLEKRYAEYQHKRVFTLAEWERI